MTTPERDAVLFPTCLVDIVEPGLADAADRLLGGTTTRPRGATCCGQPAHNAGFDKEARRVAARTLRALAATTGPVVVPSGSCATTMRVEWPRLFAGTRHESTARDVGDRVVELSDHIASQRGTVPAPSGDGGRVGLHESCHMLRELGVTDAPRELLTAAGHDIAEIEGSQRCCGFGGTFAVKLPEISVAMADEKLDEWVAADVDRVVGCDLSCLTHLEGRARRRGLEIDFEHLATTLDDGEQP